MRTRVCCRLGSGDQTVQHAGGFLGVSEPAPVEGGRKGRKRAAGLCTSARPRWVSGAEMSLQHCSESRPEDKALASIKGPSDRAASGEAWPGDSWFKGNALQRLGCERHLGVRVPSHSVTSCEPGISPGPPALPTL